MATRGDRISSGSKRGSRYNHFTHSFSLFEKDPNAEVLFEFKPKRDLDPAHKNSPADWSGFLDLSPGQDVRVNLRVTRSLPNRDFMFGTVLPHRPNLSRIQEEEFSTEEGYFPSTYVLPRSVPRIAETELKEVAFLGDGGFGQVFKHKYQGRLVAVKEVKTRRVSLDLLKEVNQEATILAKLSCLGCQDPSNSHTHSVNLCQLVGVLLDLSGLRYSLVLEFCAGGELYQLLHRDKVMLDSYELVLNFCTQIAEGLEYMHSALDIPIIHRDLKTKNVLLLNEVVLSDPTTLEGNTLKLIDFGLARELAKSHLTTDKGTYVYMAPEAIRHNRHSVYSDVWSLGVIFWELLVQVFPYPNIPEIMVLLGVAQGMVALPLPDTFPPEFKHILSKCLTKDCEDRWDIKRVVRELKTLQKLNHSDPISPLTFQASRDLWQKEAQRVEVNQSDLVEVGLGQNSTVSRMSFRAVSSSPKTTSIQGSAVISDKQSQILELKASLPLGYTERNLEEEISKTQDEILDLRHNMFRFPEAARVVLALNKLKRGARKLSEQKVTTDSIPQQEKVNGDLKEIPVSRPSANETTPHEPPGAQLNNSTRNDLPPVAESADQAANYSTSGRIPREEIVYLEQQFKLRQLQLELEKTKQMVVESQRKVEELTRKKKFRFNLFSRPKKVTASLDIPDPPSDPSIEEAVSSEANRKRSGTFSMFGKIVSRFRQGGRLATPSLHPTIPEETPSDPMHFSPVDPGCGLCPPEQETSARSAPASPDLSLAPDLLPSISQLIKPSSSEHDLTQP